MSHLHTVNSARHLTDCIRFLKQDDALLLIEDGVYCLTTTDLSQLPDSVNVYALLDDVSARGLGQRPADCCELISSKAFVQLCCDHAKVINWF